VLRGIFPPLATPFRDDGALDLRGFESNLDAYAAHDLGGYLVLGSNGESPYLDEDEKLKLVRAARKGAQRKPLLVGTGQESTRATISFTNKCAELGADAALVLTPHYYRSQMTADALRRHFEAVADASPIPVLLYSVPAFTGLTFQPALATALAGHPRVAGMKESSGDLSLLGRVIAAVPAGFAVACGSAPVLYPALCIGANAGIVAVSCCAPALACASAPTRGSWPCLAARRPWPWPSTRPLPRATTSARAACRTWSPRSVSRSRSPMGWRD
jgi:4-hydroxy-2-oxoglutarate aldolase